MGIKPSYIKTMGTALMEQHGASFNNNFDDNKRVVSEVTTIESATVLPDSLPARSIPTTAAGKLSPPQILVRDVSVPPWGSASRRKKTFFLSVLYRIVFRISASYCHGQFGFLCMSKRSYM